MLYIDWDENSTIVTILPLKLEQAMNALQGMERYRKEVIQVSTYKVFDGLKLRYQPIYYSFQKSCFSKGLYK